MRCRYLIFLFPVLCGCQTSEEFRAEREAKLNGTLYRYIGQSIADVLLAQSEFSIVNDSELGPEDKAFVLSTQPRYVTTSLPAYGMVPTVASTQMIVDCQLTLSAHFRGGAYTPENWIVRSIEHHGRGC